MKEYIINNYHKMTYGAMADELGITFYSLSKRVGTMLKSGELVGKSKSWLKEEDDFLLSVYKTVSREEIAEILGTTVGNVSDRYYKLNNGRIGLSPKSIKNRKIRQEKKDKNIIDIYNKALVTGRAEDKLLGLKLEDVKLTLGKRYSVRIPRREGSTSYEYFVGVLIQECKSHVVLRNNIGIRESFLKVDLLLEHEYKEVN